MFDYMYIVYVYFLKYKVKKKCLFFKRFEKKFLLIIVFLGVFFIRCFCFSVFFDKFEEKNFNENEKF